MKKVRIFLFLLIILPISSYGKPTNTINGLAEKYMKVKERILEDESKQREVLGSLYEVNKMMKKYVEEKNDLKQRMYALRKNIKSLAKLIVTLNKDLKKQKIFLQKRLRTLYKTGGLEFLQIFFSEKKALDVDRQLKMLSIISDRSFQMIKTYQQNAEVLKKQRGKLRREIIKSKTLERDIKQKERQLAQEQNIKSKILKSIKKAKKYYMGKLEGLREKNNKMARRNVFRNSNLSDYVFRPSLYEKKGSLPHPIKGRLIQDFGLIQHAKTKVTLSHKGYYYLAKVGTRVSAIFPGKVAYTGWVNGFGKTIIIDHGDHYYSVYGHNNSFEVKKGEEVVKGQKISTSGESSRYFEPGLYFEIRHFSEPEDPKEWIKNAKGVKISSLNKQQTGEN